MFQRLTTKTVLVIFVASCLLAGKAVARPSDDLAETDYANDDNYDGDESYDSANDNEGDETYTGPPPVIKSMPENITVQPGSMVWLNCLTENTDSFAILWYNDTQSLWTDSIKISSDNRLYKFPNNTLRISNVGPGDSARYTCEVSALPPLKLVHQLHVPSPARIIEMTPKKSVLHKGDTLTLECIVSGYPKPTITWVRKGKKLPSGETTLEANSITMEKVNRHHEGTYECTASNGLGKPVHQSVTIHVHYAPEISIEKEIVNTAEGYESELTCMVHAEPMAEVVWTRNGIPLVESAHVIITQDKSRNNLRLTNTNKNDFGSYTCRATNSLGVNEKEVKLSGMPTQPMFIPSDMSTSDGMVETIMWSVESSSPITEYELKYRVEKTKWQVESPTVVDPEGNKYIAKYELKTAVPGKYEAYVRAKNTYGWSEPSQIHHFSADFINADAAPVPAEKTQSNGVDLSRPCPRLFAVMAVISISALFL